jgi:hypothetical protein
MPEPDGAARVSGRTSAARPAARVLIAAAVVLVVAGLLVAVARWGIAGRPPVAAPATPASTSPTPPAVGDPRITPDLFLAASQLTDGAWSVERGAPPPAGFWPWRDICPRAVDPARYRSLAGRLAVDRRRYVGADGQVRVEVVERYRDAAVNLADVRARLEECRTVAKPGGPVMWGRVAEHLAGDDSILLLRVPFGPGGPQTYTVVVRVGDLVATMSLDPAADERTARWLALRMAIRLRPA